MMISIAGRNPECYIPHKQNRESCLILVTSEAKICLQTLQTCCGVVVPAV